MVIIDDVWPDQGIKSFMIYDVLIPQKIIGGKKSTLFTSMIYWMEIIMFTFKKWSLSAACIKKYQVVRRENERNHNCVLWNLNKYDTSSKIAMEFTLP